MNLLKDYNKILNKNYGYDALKPEQFNIINLTINEKKDILGILATGFGKSICYQMPYLITKKCVIVVSPLIALMADQEQELKKLKIPVCVLNSNCKNKEEIINDILENDNNRIIYITPEYMELCQAFIQTLVENKQLALIAIDEAHCVSTWGLDFRKSYQSLKNIRDWIDTSIPILALTATASKKVRKDIIKILQLEEPEIIVGDFDRKNLYISVEKREKDNSRIFELLDSYKNEYIIIYCKTREETEKLADKINDYGIKCLPYHAGIVNKKRDEIQQKFIDGKVKCMVATIAFGMGINIRNVRLVIHYNCPKNLESYYQEIGRAGRDGLASECYLFYSKKDFIINKLFLKDIQDARYKAYQEEQINIIEKYIYSNICRRLNILKHFDETYDKPNCDNCDICKNKKKKVKNTKDYSKEAFLILDLVNKLNGGYGVNTYINILRGSKAKNITEYMKNLSYYNIGKSYSVDWFKDIFDCLIIDEYLIEKKIQFSMGCVVKCSDKSIEWLKKIKTNYDKINGFGDKINFSKEDKISLTESKLMKSINEKAKSKYDDDLFTDDILDRLDTKKND